MMVRGGRGLPDCAVPEEQAGVEKAVSAMVAGGRQGGAAVRDKICFVGEDIAPTGKSIQRSHCKRLTDAEGLLMKTSV